MDRTEGARWSRNYNKRLRRQTKAEGVTFNSNSMFWIWATEHGARLLHPRPSAAGLLFLNVISRRIKVTLLLFNKLRPRRGFLKNNKCPRRNPFFFLGSPATRTMLYVLYCYIHVYIHYAFQITTLFAFLSFKNLYYYYYYFCRWINDDVSTTPPK